ncbi:GNAT family N-acetyltransferase [Sulfobacillus thermosulfidooxidans]|uniref:GNAT family N-acetyltransferase n=1 Tax=Sulfobacillus thermosulfidooxidans TaxID=28034 RepID=UPI0006B51DFD|nr:GNAT family N-acetyltransferase [Sulfobacillus thermosulfidooxidans]
MESIRVERLTAQHDRTQFICPPGGLDTYLRERARQDIRRRAAAVFVGVYPSAPQRILGYYTLSALSLKLQDIPVPYQRPLARYPDVGVTLLGRLAVDVAFHGQHIGEFLLLDALRRVVSSSSTIATAGVVVDALEGAESFYTHYGFLPLTGQRYWLPLNTVQSLFRVPFDPLLTEDNS